MRRTIEKQETAKEKRDEMKTKNAVTLKRGFHGKCLDESVAHSLMMRLSISYSSFSVLHIVTNTNTKLNDRLQNMFDSILHIIFHLDIINNN